jgi:RNA polymerase sigma-70 factor (ECF subfamily)
MGDGFPEILREAQEGDDVAFGALWRDLQPALLRYLGVVVQGAAEDVASETWARVARDLARFRGAEASFRAWVFTIARHRALDWRRHGRRHPVELAPTAKLDEHVASDDPEAAALERISTDEALALIASLPRDQAEVVVLRAVAGLDVAQVADVVGKRPGAVRVLAHRGLRRLAQRIAADEPDPRGVTP